MIPLKFAPVQIYVTEKLFLQTTFKASKNSYFILIIMNNMFSKRSYFLIIYLEGMKATSRISVLFHD